MYSNTILRTSQTHSTDNLSDAQAQTFCKKTSKI